MQFSGIRTSLLLKTPCLTLRERTMAKDILESKIPSTENPGVFEGDLQAPHDTNNFLSLLPLKSVVILPKSIIPIIVGRQTSIQAVEYALKHNNTIFITSQKNSKTENPTLN